MTMNVRTWRLDIDNKTSIGANGDLVSGANGGHNCQWHQWQHPFNWHHLIHSMVILSSQSPFRVSGSFSNTIAPLHKLIQWPGTIDDNGNSFATMALISPMATMTKMVPMATNTITMALLAPMALISNNGTNGDNVTNGPCGQITKLSDPFAQYFKCCLLKCHISHCR